MYVNLIPKEILPNSIEAYSRVKKLKFALEQTTKAQRGSRSTALLFTLTSALDRVCGQSHAPAALPPGKTRYPLHRRLGASQCRCGRARKISPPSPGIRSPDRPARSEDTYSN